MKRNLWKLAPILAGIAESMMDPARSGNRSPEDITHCLTEHELVLWAGEPGIGVDGRTGEIPPVSKEQFIAAVKTRIELGARIQTLSTP